MSFISTIAHRQPSQQGSLIDDPSWEVLTWKIGKNPYSGLVSNRNVPLSENFNSIEFDLQPDYIVCGDEHAMFLVDGKLYAIGENSDGRLGISKRNVRACNSPMLVKALSNFRVLKVSCGSKHTAALIDTGEVFTWGFGGDGQLGLRNDLTQYSPQYVHLERNEFYSKNDEPEHAIDVSCGSNHTGIISRSGDIYMFGNGASGQLGNGKLQNEHLPFKIRLQNERAERIACGKAHTLVLTARGCLYAFGSNAQGQLGTGNRKSSDVPHRVATFDKVKLIKIQADAHSAGITVTGHLYVWGPCVLGECLTPQRVCKNIENPISDVQITGNFTSLLDFKGKFWVLGAQKRGELGVESLEARTMASQISTLKDKRIRSMSCARDLLVVICEKGKGNSSPIMRAGSVSPSFKDLNASGFRRGLFETVESAIERKSHQPTQSPSSLFNTQNTRQNWRMFDRSFEGEQQERRATASSRAENIFFTTEDRVEPLLKETVTKTSVITKTEEIQKDREMEAMEEDKKGHSAREAESLDFKELKTMKELVDTMNSKEEEEAKEHREELMILREPVQEKLKATPHKKEKNMMSRGPFSLADAMNEAESFDMEEPGSYANINGTFLRRGAGEESPADKKMNESRVSDMMLDIKVMKVKNSIIESQIEEKAKQLALLESRMDLISQTELSEERSQSEVAIPGPEPIVRTLYTGDSPSKSMHTENLNTQFDAETQEDNTVSIRKHDESLVLVDSLVKENKSLKGLVNYLLQAKDKKSPEAFASDQFTHNLFQSRDIDTESQILSPTSANKRRLYARSQTMDMGALPSAESNKATALNRSIDIEVFPKIKPIQKKVLNKSLTTSNIDELLLLNDHPIEQISQRADVFDITKRSELSIQSRTIAKDTSPAQIEDLSPIRSIKSKVHMRQAETGTEPMLTIQPIQTKFYSKDSRIEDISPIKGHQTALKRQNREPVYEDVSPIQPCSNSFQVRHEKNDSEIFSPATGLGDTLLKTQDSQISPYELQAITIGTPELGNGGGSAEEAQSESYTEGLDNSLNLKSFKTSFSSMQTKNWQHEDSNKNSSKDKTSKRSSAVEAFVIAPPPGQKKKSGSKSPTRAPKNPRPTVIEPQKEDPNLLRIKKVTKSFSMSFGSEQESNKLANGTKFARTSSMRTEDDIVGISPINSVSAFQSPAEPQSQQKKMSPRGRKSPIEGASSPVEHKTTSVAKSPKSGKKVKKSKKKAERSELSISAVKTNQSIAEPETKKRNSSKTTKAEKSSSKVNRSVVMLKPTAPKEEKRMSRTGQKSMLVTFTANIKEKTPEKAAKVAKKKKASSSKVLVTEGDNITTSKVLQNPSFISSTTKSPDRSLIKSDTLSALPEKFGKIFNESAGEKANKGHSQTKSISIIKESSASNYASKYEEEKDSTIFDIINNSYTKPQQAASFVEKPLSYSEAASPIPEKRQVSYSQAEALARLLGASKAKKVTKNKMMKKAASKSGIKRTNTTEFYDQLTEVIKVNTTMK